MDTSPLVFDSVTMLGPEVRGQVAIAASHAGAYAAYLAASAGLAGVILSDAGVGRERAGIAGLAYLDELGIAAGAISHRSARIGDGADCAAEGVISFANAVAIEAGVRAGMRALEALRVFAQRRAATRKPPSPQHEIRHRLTGDDLAGVHTAALDSASLVCPEDDGGIVLTGSHGGLMGADIAKAIRRPVYAAVFNDADRGKDDAGVSRLPALDQRGIAAATVSAWSARIGDGLSTYRDGFISAVNGRAAALGGEIGQSAREFVRQMARARAKEQQG